MPETERTEYDAAFEAGVARARLEMAGRLVELPEGSAPVLLLPEGIEAVDAEQYLPAPTRIRADVTLHDVESLCWYAKAEVTPTTLLFASPAKAIIVAVLDYHGGGHGPSWCSHKATLQLVQSPEWRVWTGAVGREMTQEEFAKLLDANRLDIAKPDAGTVIDAVEAFELHRSVKFKSGFKVISGAVTLQYEEQDGSDKGEIKAPVDFTLAIPVFERGALVEVQAHVRYRPSAEGLKVRYLIDKPHELLRSAFDRVVADIGAATGLSVLLGTP